MRTSTTLGPLVFVEDRYVGDWDLGLLRQEHDDAPQVELLVVRERTGLRLDWYSPGRWLGSGARPLSEGIGIARQLVVP